MKKVLSFIEKVLTSELWVITIACVLLIIACFAMSSCTSVNEQSDNQKQVNNGVFDVTEFVYMDHEYICFEYSSNLRNRREGFVHNPECKHCKAITVNDSLSVAVNDSLSVKSMIHCQ